MYNDNYRVHKNSCGYWLLLLVPSFVLHGSLTGSASGQPQMNSIVVIVFGSNIISLNNNPCVLLLARGTDGLLAVARNVYGFSNNDDMLHPVLRNGSPILYSQ